MPAPRGHTFAEGATSLAWEKSRHASLGRAVARYLAAWLPMAAIAVANGACA